MNAKELRVLQILDSLMVDIYHQTKEDFYYDLSMSLYLLRTGKVDDALKELKRVIETKTRKAG